MPCPQETTKRVVKEHPNFTFARLVDAILEAKGVKIHELIEQTGYNKTTIYNIRYKSHIPDKITAITIGVALGLNLEQMEVFLYKAGFVLCPSIDSDRHYLNVIVKYDDDGLRRVIDCNIELHSLGVKEKELLGNFSDRRKKKTYTKSKN